MEDMILISPAGDVEAFVMEWIKEAIRDIFNVTTHIGEQIPVPQEAFNPERAQYLAPIFLRYMSTSMSYKNLLLTHVDLYIEGLNYVFGYAIPEKRVAIVSTARFRKNLLQRALKTAIHEIGHLYGLSHCRGRRCVMYFSFDVYDTDYKGYELCKECRGVMS